MNDRQFVAIPSRRPVGICPIRDRARHALEAERSRFERGQVLPLAKDLRVDFKLCQPEFAVQIV